MSRIGNKSITVPDKVKINLNGSRIRVEGPKGALEMDISPRVTAKLDGAVLSFARPSDTKKDKAFHGLTRALVQNMVTGTHQGFRKVLLITGVGFKAAVQGKIVNLSLGFSHPIHHPIPEGISVKVEENTKIIIEGIDKQKVGALAAELRSYYPPEPYKGKGVRYDDEIIRRKEGKTAQGK
ncbi:MAG: 50S ribosomal protein L6 [Candidatus Methylacidiphilales bacterium]